MIKDYFVLAIRNLIKRKIRSWLTIVGIVISIATIFMLVSISIGLQGAITEQFRVLGADKFFIMPKGSIGGPGTSSAVSLTTDDVDVIRRVNGVKDATYISIKNAEIKFNDHVRFFMVAGFPADGLKMLSEVSSYTAEDGHLVGKGYLGSVMIGSQYKYNNLFGKPVKVGNTIFINGIGFRVVGILKTLGNPSDDQMVYMLYDDFKIVFPEKKDVDEIMVQISPGLNVKDVAARVEKKLRSFRGVTDKTQDFTVLTPEELLGSFTTILNIVTAFLIGIAAISLLVGGIGIANTMFTSVIERTREIGTMKAVGAKNSDILLIFLIESGLLGTVGGILGVALGILLAKSVELIATQQLSTNLLQAALPSYLIIGCVAFAFLIGAVSGIWPAWRASKLITVEALRYE